MEWVLSLIIGIVVAVVSVYLAHRLAIKWEKLQVGKIVLDDVEKIKGNVTDLKDDVGEIDERLGLIERAMLAIQNAVIKLSNPPEDKKIDKPGSPPELTSYGQKLADQSKITQHITQNTSRFIKEIGPNKTESTIFDKAQLIANKEFAVESPLVSEIRSHFYQESLDVLVMYRVYALKLRDLVIQNQKGNQKIVDSTK